VDAGENVLVAGQTESSEWLWGGFDTSHNGGRDAFVAKIGRWPIATACVDDDNTTGIEDGSPQHPFSSIQQGIAATADGGTVKVARGTYSENLTISSKRVTIQGGYAGGTYPGTGDFTEDNRDSDPATNQTVIDGGGTGAAILCQDAAAEGSVLTGFAIRNGGATFRGIVLKQVIADHE
jgi:hypothetical protein